jgi:hypothetical protein
MKKLLQLIIFSSLALGATAQQKQDPKQTEGPKAVQRQTEYDLTKINRDKQYPDRGGDRVVVFHETFENGFNGSTEHGAWTASHSLSGVSSNQGSQWLIGDTNYVNFYGNGVPGFNALVSASPTKYAVWDGAAYAQLYPTSALTNSFYSGYLTSPELNLSELSTVLVDFQQTFRYCCFAGSPVSLDVSVDGGVTWTSFNALGDAIEGSNIQSPNPMNTMIDISCVAAEQPSVRLRFSYNSAQAAGYNYYYWGIDEVVVYGSENENDLFIKELVCGDLSTNWEFRVTPMEQVISAENGGVRAGVLAGNKGMDEQSEVTVVFTFDGPDGEYIYTTPSFHLYSALTDTVCPHVETSLFIWATGFVPSTPGTYTLRAEILGLEENEEALLDNMIEETIVFNNIGEYGHDGDTPDEFQWQVGSRQLANGQREPSGFGSHFTFPNSGSMAHGITVRFGSNTVSGIEFKAGLIAQSNQVLETSPLVASGDYETRDGWNNAEPLFFAFNDVFPVGGVFPAQPYSVSPWSSNINYTAVIWRQNQGVGNLTVRAQEHNDLDLSSVAWERGGDQNFHWFHFQEFNYAVRLILSNEHHINVSTEELEAPKASFQLYPNPAVDETRISFELAESTFIAYEVRDLQGRLMDTDNIGRFGAGNNSFTINVNNYPAGNYIVSLVMDGQRLISQQLSVVK